MHKLKNIPTEQLCRCVILMLRTSLWVCVVFSLMSLAKISGVEGRQRRGRVCSPLYHVAHFPLKLIYLASYLQLWGPVTLGNRKGVRSSCGTLQQTFKSHNNEPCICQVGSVAWALVTCRENFFMAVLEKIVVLCFPLWVTRLGDSGDIFKICAPCSKH